MAYTLGNPIKMLGTYWAQETRIYHVRSMKDRIVDALLKYRKHVQKFPTQILVYRSGVSEGEFDLVSLSAHFAKSS